MKRALGWGFGTFAVCFLLACCGDTLLPSLGEDRIRVHTIPESVAFVVGAALFIIPVVMGVTVFIAVLAAERRRR